jgi:hypothetical protein
MKHLFGHQLAIVTMLCIVGIFLFPVAIGPYPAVHGPGTALLAFRAAMKLRLAIALAAFCNLVFSLAGGSRFLPGFSSRIISADSRPDVLCLRC